MAKSVKWVDSININPLVDSVFKSLAGFRLVDEAWIAQNTGVYSPVLMDHRTIDRRNWTLFFLQDGTGWGLCQLYWEKRVLWCAFGCDHDMVFVQNLGRCYNQYRCSKCGYEESIDSSD